MAAKPLSKTKIVAHIAEKLGTPKKQVATFFEELHKLAVKEAKGGAGKFVIPGIGRVVRRTARRAWAAIRKPAKQSRSRQRPWCGCARPRP